MAKLSDFDMDLSYGQEGETLVRELLTGGKTIEVKRDRKWHTTGNLYIETECWSTAINAWLASGLTITKAAYWAFVLEEGVVIVPTEAVCHAVNNYGHKIECTIEPNNSRGYLIKVDSLMKALKELK
jgi:hypothetical protein